MRIALRRTVLVSAGLASVMLMTCGPAGTAGAASIGPSSPVAARAAAGGALGNYQISGVEDAIECLTAHRCVAVGYRGGKAPGQVVTVVSGKQERVTTVPSASNLFAVSCPNRFGCWAIGSPRIGRRNYVLVKISAAGSVTRVTTVRVQGGVSLGSMSCASMTSCEIFGITTDAYSFNRWYFASWTGTRLSQHYVVGAVDSAYDSLGVISCLRATCVAVSTTICGGSTCVWQGAIVITNHGKPGNQRTVGNGIDFTGFSAVSCVSSSTCYATQSSYPIVYNPPVTYAIVTLHDGVPVNTQDEPVGALAIECAGTCWAAGGSAFVMITNGVPASTPVTDPTVSVRSIARRGNSFAAVGTAVSGGPRVSEIVTN